MTPTTSEREAFEAWVRQRHGLSTEKWADSGKYKYDDTHRWWECWQAALTRREAQQEAQGAVAHDVAMEGWHSAVDAAGELCTNAPDERYRTRAESVRQWIVRNKPTTPPAPVDVRGLRGGEYHIEYVDVDCVRLTPLNALLDGQQAGVDCG